MLQQYLIIFGITYLGEIISKYFNLPIPGTVLALLIMFFILYTGILKLKYVEKAADILLINMAIFFIPPGVKLINSLDILKGNWSKLMLTAVLSTIVTMGVTCKVVEFCIRRKK